MPVIAPGIENHLAIAVQRQIHLDVLPPDNGDAGDDDDDAGDAGDAGDCDDTVESEDYYLPFS